MSRNVFLGNMWISGGCDLRGSFDFFVGEDFDDRNKDESGRGYTSTDLVLNMIIHGGTSCSVTIFVY